MSGFYPSREHPHSAKELSDMASDFGYDIAVPLKYWIRTAENLLREANIYAREGNDQMAYFLLFRHANLVVEYLYKHPQAKLPEHKASLAAMRDRLPKVMQSLEGLKPRIEQRYEAYQAAAKERKQRQRQKDYEYQQQQEQAFLQQQQKQRPKHLSQSSRSRASSGASSDNQRDPRAPVEPYAAEGSRYGYGSIGSERSSKRQSIPPSLVPGSSASTSASASARSSQQHFEEHGWSYEPASPTSSSSHSHRPRSSRSAEEELFDIQKTLQNLQIQTKSPLPASLQRDLQEKVESKSPVSYSVRNGHWSGNYPSIPKRSSWQGPPPVPKQPDAEEYVPQSLERLPTLPPKVRDSSIEQTSRYLDPSRPPPRPAKPPRSPAPVPAPAPSPSPQPPASAFDSYEFKPVAYTEAGSPLRTIFIPETLRSEFLRVALPNTRANLETCGILCGFLKQNALFVNRLVIPEQEATSDTCQTTDEAALLEYVDTEELLVLGWIHTHPTQTCFMSSVDLHTQCGYQLQLAESIAIVCAPRHEPSWGVYRLTDPPGLKAITVCRNPGLFHPHDVDDVYTDALRPGHVCEVKEMGFRTVDLRKKKLRS